MVIFISSLKKRARIYKSKADFASRIYNGFEAEAVKEYLSTGKQCKRAPMKRCSFFVFHRRKVNSHEFFISSYKMSY